MEVDMSKLLVTDELWSRVEPLLPKHEPSPKGGHPPVDDRVCLTGILFVLKTGIPWEDFPQELGCCGMTLWNRFPHGAAVAGRRTAITIAVAAEAAQPGEVPPRQPARVLA